MSYDYDAVLFFMCVVEVFHVAKCHTIYILVYQCKPVAPATQGRAATTLACKVCVCRTGRKRPAKKPKTKKQQHIILLRLILTIIKNKEEKKKQTLVLSDCTGEVNRYY